MLSTTVNTKAYELRVLGHITDRIDELMQEHAERHKLTVDDLIDQLEEARQMAIKTEQSSSMISATMGSAKLLGLDKPAPDGDDEGQELTINFSVSAPVGEIKVTKGKPKDE